ncbi:ethylbenzene dehydrogenase-related protein [Nitrospina watsonii]|uniref:Nitrite oxidoreductase, gamma subunit n=1 Tax=Nitrospina watsonii TaxID=1323948 RepID=A0ABN8W194_9BACT|nr:ethylbenzene dehydrogenase-related protein [Nitrospina watsonii]CAI2718862.1 putative nitrite oxidoreductase, gamma subunit [Nitrospina watsonii]
MASSKAPLWAFCCFWLLVMAATPGGAVTIEALRVQTPIPLNPMDPFWSRSENQPQQNLIDLLPQMITNPMWPDPATKWVMVQAAVNDRSIAIRLEWVDATRNDILVQSQQYRDQAAIMFPVDQQGPLPPFTMGGEGEPVNIWQWKATWDKEGAGYAGNEMMQDIEDQYQYMAMGSGSYYIYEPDGGLKLSDEQRKHVSERQTFIDPGMGKNEGVYNPGRATGNILSDNTLRHSPVEDLNAEGFSTLTTQAEQNVDGYGNWSNSRWSVVFKRTLKTGDKNDTQFEGQKTAVAFAIWNGRNKERNGQKGVTPFHELSYR